MAKHSSVTLKSTRGRFLRPLLLPASSLLASQIETILFKTGGSRDGNEESAQTRKTTWRKKSRRFDVLVAPWGRIDGRWMRTTCCLDKVAAHSWSLITSETFRWKLRGERSLFHDRGKRDGFSASSGFLSSSNNRGTWIRRKTFTDRVKI